MTRTGRIAILTAGTCIVLATAVRAEADRRNRADLDRRYHAFAGEGEGDSGAGFCTGGVFLRGTDDKYIVIK